MADATKSDTTITVADTKTTAKLAEGRIAMRSLTGADRNRGNKPGTQGIVIPFNSTLVMNLSDFDAGNPDAISDPFTLQAIMADTHVLWVRTDTPATPAGDIKRFLQQ